ENLTPCGISGCAAAMALVNNDEIKEVAGELFIKLLALFRSGDGLIEREVDLKGRINAAVPANGRFDCLLFAVVTLNGFRAGAELGHGWPERAKIIDHSLIYEHVAVSEKEDPLFTSGFPQAPDDLKSSISLACTSGHDEQNAVLAVGNGLNGLIDGDALVITR